MFSEHITLPPSAAQDVRSKRWIGADLCQMSNEDLKNFMSKYKIGRMDLIRQKLNEKFGEGAVTLELLNTEDRKYELKVKKDKLNEICGKLALTSGSVLYGLCSKAQINAASTSDAYVNIPVSQSEVPPLVAEMYDETGNELSKEELALAEKTIVQNRRWAGIPPNTAGFILRYPDFPNQKLVYVAHLGDYQFINFFAPQTFPETGEAFEIYTAGQLRGIIEEYKRKQLIDNSENFGNILKRSKDWLNVLSDGRIFAFKNKEHLILSFDLEEDRKKFMSHVGLTGGEFSWSCSNSGNFSLKVDKDLSEELQRISGYPLELLKVDLENASSITPATQPPEQKNSTAFCKAVRETFKVTPTSIAQFSKNSSDTVYYLIFDKSADRNQLANSFATSTIFTTNDYRYGIAFTAKQFMKLKQTLNMQDAQGAQKFPECNWEDENNLLKYIGTTTAEEEFLSRFRKIFNVSEDPINIKQDDKHNVFLTFFSEKNAKDCVKSLNNKHIEASYDTVLTNGSRGYQLRLKNGAMESLCGSINRRTQTKGFSALQFVPTDGFTEGSLEQPIAQQSIHLNVSNGNNNQSPIREISRTPEIHQNSYYSQASQGSYAQAGNNVAPQGNGGMPTNANVNEFAIEFARCLKEFFAKKQIVIHRDVTFRRADNTDDIYLIFDSIDAQARNFLANCWASNIIGELLNKNVFFKLNANQFQTFAHNISFSKNLKDLRDNLSQVSIEKYSCEITTAQKELVTALNRLYPGIKINQYEGGVYLTFPFYENFMDCYNYLKSRTKDPFEVQQCNGSFRIGIKDPAIMKILCEGAGLTDFCPTSGFKNDNDNPPQHQVQRQPLTNTHQPPQQQYPVHGQNFNGAATIYTQPQTPAWNGHYNQGNAQQQPSQTFYPAGGGNPGLFNPAVTRASTPYPTQSGNVYPQGAQRGFIGNPNVINNPQAGMMGIQAGMQGLNMNPNVPMAAQPFNPHALQTLPAGQPGNGQSMNNTGNYDPRNNYHHLQYPAAQQRVNGQSMYNTANNNQYNNQYRRQG